MKRGLSREEAALWARVAQTVRPMEGKVQPLLPPAQAAATKDAPVQAKAKRAGRAVPQPAAAIVPPKRDDRPLPPQTLDRHGLDASWDRRLSRGLVAPDFTLDLHGSTLDAAHGRLEHGLTLAASQGARLVLLITGRSRPGNDRAGRGVIRRKFMDWLQVGPHAGKIAAIRSAHPRHGGAGAIYIVLKRAR